MALIQCEALGSILSSAIIYSLNLEVSEGWRSRSIAEHLPSRHKSRVGSSLTIKNRKKEKDFSIVNLTNLKWDSISFYIVNILNVQIIVAIFLF